MYCKRIFNFSFNCWQFFLLYIEYARGNVILNLKSKFRFKLKTPEALRALFHNTCNYKFTNNLFTIICVTFHQTDN